MRNTEHLTRAQMRKLMFTLSEKSANRIRKVRKADRGLLAFNPCKMDGEEMDMGHCDDPIDPIIDE